MLNQIAVQNDPDDVFNILKTRYEELKGKRGTWETHWQQIADLMHPFDDNFISRETPGAEKMTYIFDSTPIHANQLLASGLFSMLTSPAQKWFFLTTMDTALLAKREVKMWLDMVARVMYHEINKPVAQFNTSMHELYMEYGAFGNGILFVDETLDRRNLYFQSLPLSETYLTAGHDGSMDAMFRRYPRTVRQLNQKFGAKNLPEGIQKKTEDDKLEDVVEGIHVVVPATDYGVKSRFPYLSAYLDLDNAELIGASGYFELPFMAPRFYKNPWEQYGRGPGSTALPDIKMLQEVMRTTIRAAQKATDPPLQAPDDGFLNPVRTTPGGINFYRAGTADRIEPIKMGSNPGIGFDVVGDLRSRIREIFFIDQLQLQEGPQMTATEVLQRTEEKLRLMGPLMGRLQTELLGPCLSRVFGILLRQGKIPEMPEVLRQAEMKVMYTSPIARAQEQTEANSIMRSLQVLTPFLEMDPQTTDNFNGDELTKGVFDMFNVSPRFLNSAEVIAQKRKSRQKDKQENQQASNMQSAGQGFESITRAGMNLQEMGGGGE